MNSAAAIIVGAGPAGLATAACLAQEGIDAVLLERGKGVGESWRRHYRRLHLHTVKELSELPWMPWWPEAPRYPSRLDVIEYLERYARHFELEPRCGVEVQRAYRHRGRWQLETSEGEWRTDQLVCCTGHTSRPRTPSWPGQDSFAGSIEHSSSFDSGAAWSGRDVLVVGAGNSGAEIALDLYEQGARTTIAVRSGQHVIPRDFLGMPSQKSSVRMRMLPLGMRDVIASAISKLAFGDLARYGIRRPDTGPISRIVHQRRLPLLDIGTVARIKSGEISVAPGIGRFGEREVLFVDGSKRPFDHVVLATGYTPGLDQWIDGIDDALDEHGGPRVLRGRIATGLYVVGYQSTPTGLLRQIAEDAPVVAAKMARDIEASS